MVRCLPSQTGGARPALLTTTASSTSQLSRARAALTTRPLRTCASAVHPHLRAHIELAVAERVLFEKLNRSSAKRAVNLARRLRDPREEADGQLRAVDVGLKRGLAGGQAVETRLLNSILPSSFRIRKRFLQT